MKELTLYDLEDHADSIVDDLYQTEKFHRSNSGHLLRVKKAFVREKIVKKTAFAAFLDYLKELKDKMYRKGKEPIILSVNSEYKTKWDLFVMFLAAYNCF